MLAAGCGSAAGQATAPARPATPPSLATSLATATGTWAVAVMGGSAASHNNFWQLFVRPDGTSTWRLATPPGVASNGGLVLTGLPAGSVLAGFRPSQDLAYSPLAITKDNGRTWSPALLDAGLADVPGALAADPASGRLLALLTDGTAEMSGPGGTAWTRLTTRHALATSPAGTRCEPGSLNAAAFSPSGQPMLAAGCGRPGTAGIFSRTGRTWQLTGPALPAAYAHQAITVLRLTTTGEHHHGAAGRRNRVSGTPAGRLVCRRRRALETVTAAAAERRHADIGVVRAWQQPGDHPEPPPRGGHQQRRGLVAAAAAAAPGTATLAPGPSGGWNALAVHGTQLTIWQAAPGARAWASARSSRFPSNSDHQADATPVPHLVRRLFQRGDAGGRSDPPLCMRARTCPDVPRSRRGGHRPEPRRRRRSGDTAAVV